MSRVAAIAIGIVILATAAAGGWYSFNRTESSEPASVEPGTPDEALRVFNSPPMAELPGQTNRVNVELSTGVKTLIFRGNGDGKTVPVEFKEGD